MLQTPQKTISNSILCFESSKAAVSESKKVVEQRPLESSRRRGTLQGNEEGYRRKDSGT